MTDRLRPQLKVLTDDRIGAVIDDALRILEDVGVAVEHTEAVELLAGAGAKISDDGTRVHIPADLCQQCVASAPSEFSLYDRDGNNPITIGGETTHFDPGSAALTLYDYERGEIRDPDTKDVVDFAVLTDRISAYDCQSTGVIPADVPAALADRFRLLISLIYGKKPVITGTFSHDGFETMHALLCAVRGGHDDLAKKPLALFDCCPTAPLSWSELTCDALISCARNGIPAEIVSMPLTGATAPVTLAGAIVQHAAENLSGIVIHQLAGKGSPVVFGGAPSCFDMRKATTPMGSVETMLIDASYAHVGKKLGLPVHTYLGLSDAKLPDYQAGFETGMGVVVAALAGVNVVSGPGMLNFVGTQSLEKLVLDGEICAMAKRLIDGVDFSDSSAAIDVIRRHADDKSFLTDDHTRANFRKEVYFPSDVIDRGSQGDWESTGRLDSLARAHAKIPELIEAEPIEVPDAQLVDELESIVLADARAHGVDTLPDWRTFLP